MSHVKHGSHLLGPLPELIIVCGAGDTVGRAAAMNPQTMINWRQAHPQR